MIKLTALIKMIPVAIGATIIGIVGIIGYYSLYLLHIIKKLLTKSCDVLAKLLTFKKK
jgi:hypothetical protein